MINDQPIISLNYCTLIKCQRQVFRTGSQFVKAKGFFGSWNQISGRAHYISIQYEANFDAVATRVKPQ